MGAIRRLAEIDKSKIEGSSQASTPAILNAVQAEPAKPTVSAESVQIEANALDSVKTDGALKRMKESGERRKEAHKASIDFLNILKALAPVFKAATIYPGHDAPAEKVAMAVRRLSEASVSLAEYIADTGDTLEVDTAWARKTLHEFTAELVSSYWITKVIQNDGATDMPEVSADFFKPAISVVMALPGVMPGRVNLNLSTNGAVNLSLLKALTPISIEIERFTTFIGIHVPNSKASSNDIISEVSQFLIEQALIHYERFIADNPESTEDDKRSMLQSLIGHASSVILSSWEYCKGEVYSAVSSAQSGQAALEYLSQEQFTHGFPLNTLKKRAEDSLRRLVASASYALAMIQRQSDEPKA